MFHNSTVQDYEYTIGRHIQQIVKQISNYYE